MTTITKDHTRTPIGVLVAIMGISAAASTVHELADHPVALTPDERDDFARRSDFVKKWQAGRLRSPAQLPDLSGNEITLFWDNDHDTNEIIIRTNDRVIWRQPLGYEHYDYFVDALKILKAKYGWALVDVIPTERAHLYLWGDRLSAPEICVEARRKLLRSRVITP